VALSWSGGKDCSLALQAVLADPALRVDALVTTVTEGYDRISMHGVRRELLEAQVARLGIPVHEARIPIGASNASYESAMAVVLRELTTRGITRVVFGDLFLTDVREYRERLLGALGMRGHYPLWMQDTRRLAHTFIEDGFRAVLVCVDPRQIDPALCGREFDHALLADLPPSADPCGEKGEFHTFVYDGPLFEHAIPIERGDVVERDGFWFADLRVAGSG
jgi:uncharacterized protein (TIGR00290 family)